MYLPLSIDEHQTGLPVFGGREPKRETSGGTRVGQPEGQTRRSQQGGSQVIVGPSQGQHS